MKKAIIMFLLLAVTAASFGQQTKPTPTLTRQDYLQKSKDQKKAALIMLIGGGALVGTAFIFPKGEYQGTELSIYGFVDEYSNDGIRAFILLTGTASMLGSILLFIASGKNKRRALNIAFQMRTVPQLQNNKLFNQSIPSINLKLSL